MKLDLSKMPSDKANIGDIIIVEHKGMGVREAYLIAKVDTDIMAISLDGDSHLGIYFTVESLIQDLRTEPLIEKIFIASKENYTFKLELMK